MTTMTIIGRKLSIGCAHRRSGGMARNPTIAVIALCVIIAG
ncbi:MAG: hypothetical protein ACT4OX_09665 [Actinomycetota bacterium]